MKTKFGIIILCSLLLASCATRNYRTSNTSGWEYNNTRFLDDNNQTDKEDSRMMIYNASITIEAKNPDSVSIRVAEIAKKHKGYVLSTSNNETTIRVLSSSLNEALNEIGTYGKVTNKNITGTDVTDEFTDYQIRLENAERTRKRYLELLEKAINVDETLKIEKELERLNGQIDLLKGKMNRINHLVDYSTIKVYHSKKVKLGVLGYAFIGSYKAVKWLFVRN